MPFGTHLDAPTPESSPDLFSDEAAFLSQLIETQSDIAAIELDLPTIMQMVAQRTQRLTGADGASVQIVERDHLICRAVSGIMEGYAGIRLALHASLAGHAARLGRYEYCPDIENDQRVDRNAARGMGIRSVIVVPIFQGAQVVGILNVSSTKPGAFRPRHVSALGLMAGLVAAALGHAAEFEAKKALLAERTEALTALAHSEERFRSAFDHAAIGMAIVALDGRWLQVNHSICQIVGYTEQELLVRDFQSITHPDDLQADLAQVKRLLAGQVRDYQMVKRYIHRRGHLVWVLLSVSLVRDAEGRPLHFIAQIQDITRRKEAEDALRASEDEYRTTFEMAGVGKSQVDLATGRFIRVNAKLCDILGYSADELCATTLGQLTHPDDLASGLDIFEKLRRGELQNYSAEKRYVRKDGRVIWTSLNITVINGGDGRPARAIAAMLDVTDRKLAEQLERDRRRVLEMVARDMPLPKVLDRLATAMEQQVIGSTAAIAVLQDGKIMLHGPSLAPEWRSALGAHALRLAADLTKDVWEATDRCGVTFVDHNEIWADVREIAARHGVAASWTMAIEATDSVPLGLLTIFAREPRRPTTAEVQTLSMSAKLAGICIEHHNTTRQLSHLVRHDSLTGLPNRVMFEDRLQHALDLADRSGKQVGVMVLDIDKFKAVNDSFGHDAGDQLLQQFSHRIRSMLRDADTMARLGGDEFVIVLPELETRDRAEVVAQKLVQSMAQPFEIGGRSLQVTTSIGIATLPEDGRDSATLKKRADAALYRVKERGRNGFGY
jgi:diguanylate cyclase (GGDEF)-like protein/PAS domain S-box-containing protein